MIAAGVNREFGVIASDSARYENDETSFETPKLLYLGQNYIVTCLGNAEYLLNMDLSKFNDSFFGLIDYLMKYLIEIKYGDGRFCLFIMGVYNGYPILCQFNSFNDFKPEVLYSEGPLAFSNIYYGEDEDKNNIFQRSTKYMEKLSKKYEKITPGIVGEILTRGIYHKADSEEKISKKYAGGAVSVALIFKDGRVIPLSNLSIGG
jgi:hypothetical protein